MKKRILFLLIGFLFLGVSQEIQAQKKSKKSKTVATTSKQALDELSLSGLRFRSVGPAFTSGRIADFAMHPDNPNEYYVATAAGGVWKTKNAGTTYNPIFDSQGSYSIGCVTIDGRNPNTVWVGTGENNNQRSVGYGDGIYKSTDGGASWQHKGLKMSEHIGKIIVHPDNSDVIWVAAIGPLWSKGGDRGVYKSTDGGDTWMATLSIDEHTGVSDLVIDPRNPQVLYASAFQRRRHVFTYLGGGPQSAMYKSVDGGDNWTKINNGLPSVDIGRIGLAISPVNPEIIYAIVEAAQGKSGFYKSTNRGASWQKQGGHVTSGNYYQEIVADPVDANTVYSMDTWLSVTHNGGKSFSKVGEDTKHVDNHCMWINPNNNQHWLVGCDGGIYETWDAAKTWDFKANLPVTQFYKVALDNAEPFYNIYGGTQDNFSIGGPSRTNTSHGIMNSDWFITHGGDGFESQVDPYDPNIVYAQSQYGVLVRFDRKTGEETGIQPKERKDENGYRWNWDAPLAVSAHKKGRLYFAANKLFRSDDYGNEWDVLSEDLTQQINRNELKVMDRIWGVDAVAKNRSTSPYGTIVAFSESPINENLLIVGTDDGLIQITDNGGATWRKVANISGVPPNSYVNAVYASQHDEKVIYAAFNHHKYGDFKPYIYKSNDKGATWRKISANLPERGSVYTIEEDHVNKDLIFCGTEFGLFFSPNGGGRWKAIKSGLPTVAVRDIAIQKRENDLVLGTFGRGFYVLDDYSALRQIENKKPEGSQLFAVREALQYEKNQPLGLPGKSFQGDSFYTGENLGPVALITYYGHESVKSMKDERQAADKKAAKDGKGNPYPSYEDLRKENEEFAPQMVFTIKNGRGNVVRKITKGISEGLQRFEWDLRYASKEPIELHQSSFYNPFAGKSEGTLVQPGAYTIEMATSVNGVMESVGEAVSFEVKSLNNGTMQGNRADKVAFQREVAELSRAVQGAGYLLGELDDKLAHIRKAILQVEQPMDELTKDANAIQLKMKEIRRQLYGDNIKSRLDIDQPPTPSGRLGWIDYEQKYSTSAPTKTHMMSFEIAKADFAPILEAIKKLANEDMNALEQKLEDADAPYTPGRAIKLLNGY